LHGKQLEGFYKKTFFKRVKGKKDLCAEHSGCLHEKRPAAHRGFRGKTGKVDYINRKIKNDI